MQKSSWCIFTSGFSPILLYYMELVHLHGAYCSILPPGFSQITDRILCFILVSKLRPNLYFEVLASICVCAKQPSFCQYSAIEIHPSSVYIKAFCVNIDFLVIHLQTI